MKIIYPFAYFGNGGAEEHVILLARKAREAGNEPIFIISVASDSALQRLNDEKFKVIRLAMNSSFNPFLVYKSVKGLKRIVSDEKVDIIHAHMLREQSIAVIAKTIGAKFRLIRTFHRFDQFNWKLKPLLSIYFKYTDMVISISDLMGQYLEENGLKGRYKVVENGVAKVEVENHEQALGFMGRLAKEKGILEFIRVNIDVFHDIKLVIAGDGPDFNEIKKLVDDNKLNIELLGSVSDKVDFYKKISVLVLPSETEVLPLVVLEAFSCGVPVVAFNIESLKGLIPKENGKLTNFLDYKQMCSDGLMLMSNTEKYRNANIDKYDKFYSDQIMWNKTNQIYQSILDIKQ